MKVYKIVLTFILLLTFLSSSVLAEEAAPTKTEPTIPKIIEGPVVPTKEMISRSATPKKTIEELDLPYKPKDIDTEIEDDTNNQGLDVNITEDSTVTEAKPQKPEIDWSKIPFIPSKNPELSPAGDPEIK